MRDKDIRLMQEKLKQAQSLLSDVYHYACDEGIDFVERSMSCADDCVIESKNWLGQIEEQLIDDASWRA
jgi:hypothetical protein